MLFRQDALRGIADGSVTLAFRRWKRLGVRPGTRLRTAVGVVEITAVEAVEDDRVTEAEMRAAGYASPEPFRRELARHPDGTLYRIGVRFAGADPRVELRERAPADARELADVHRRLARIDAASRRGPWTGVVLRLIGERPGAPAAALAERLGRETLSLKRDIRRLKELGLTESLSTGYRLSPRGETVTRTREDGARD
ncbi:hypothetical protein ACIQNU_16440 [Streptomyces sp. NPDC091292]|uniref:hypothetical protein n=1 Tax=Streptomyces sp. NPDC091292 TaxID=3365991 RepID=UPI00381A9D0F